MTSSRRFWERFAVVLAAVGGVFFIAALTVMMTPAPVIVVAVLLPIGLAALVIGIALTLILRRGVAADTWPRSGRKVAR